MVTLDELVGAAEEQGWRTRQTRKGVMFSPPDATKQQVLIHRNPTEVALRKTLSRMRHAGFVWPWPQKG